MIPSNATVSPPEQLKAELLRATTPEMMADALSHAYDAIDIYTRGYLTQRGVHLDCRAGCSLCCYLRVDAKAHEIFAIADYVNRHFTEPERTQLIARLEDHAARVNNLGYTEQMAQNIKCPLLVDGRCSVYPVRPFGCRRHQSQRVAACQYSFDHPGDLDAPSARHPGLFIASMQREQGLQSAYSALRYDLTGYELGTALLEALTDSNTWRRWRSRKPPFTNALTVPPEINQ